MTRHTRKPDSGTVDNRRHNLLEGPELLSNSGLEVEGELELGNCRHELFPVVSGSTEKKAGIVCAKKNTNHPALRLVVSRDDLPDVPRKYDQSTSGRVSSTGTAPELSRSNAIAVDSAIRSFVDKAFRRYPSEVPQRPAYASCASRSSELRYDLSDSILRTLPDSNLLAIPFVHLPGVAAPYYHCMDRDELKRVRKRRLALLVEEFGSQVALAKTLNSEPNLISQLLTNPRKSFGEKVARNIESKCRKPRGWLDTDEEAPTPPPTDWPFSFDRSHWDRLAPEQQTEIESALKKLILGAGVQEFAVKRPKRRSA